LVTVTVAVAVTVTVTVAVAVTEAVTVAVTVTVTVAVTVAVTVTVTVAVTVAVAVAVTVTVAVTVAVAVAVAVAVVVTVAEVSNIIKYKPTRISWLAYKECKMELKKYKNFNHYMAFHICTSLFPPNKKWGIRTYFKCKTKQWRFKYGI
jgi:hypothetical protein